MDEYTFLPDGLQSLRTETRLEQASTKDAPRPQDALWDLQPRASQTNMKYARTEASRRNTARRPQHDLRYTQSQPSQSDSKHSIPDALPNPYDAVAEELQHDLPHIPPQGALLDQQTPPFNVSFHHTDASRTDYTPPDARPRPPRSNTEDSRPDATARLRAGTEELERPLLDRPRRPSQEDSNYSRADAASRLPAGAQESERPLPDRPRRPSRGNSKYSRPGPTSRPQAGVDDTEHPLPDRPRHPSREDSNYSRPGPASRPQAGVEDTDHPLPDRPRRPSREDSNYSRPGPTSRPQAGVEGTEPSLQDRKRRPSRGDSNYSRPGPTSRPSEAGVSTVPEHERPLPDPHSNPTQVDLKYSRPEQAAAQEPERPLPSRADSKPSRPSPLTTRPERPLPDPQPRPSQVTNYSRPGAASRPQAGAQESERPLADSPSGPTQANSNSNSSRPGATSRPEAGTTVTQEPERPPPKPQPRPSQANSNSSRPSATTRPQPGTATPTTQTQEPETASKPQSRPSQGNSTKYSGSGATPRKPEHTAPDLQATDSSQMHTKYVNMLLALDTIPRMDNILASFFTWILLAGFILFPGTFTSLQNSQSAIANGEVGKEVLKAVAHVPLFVIAFLCCGIGAAGMGYLWWKWMYNYIWLVNKIFMPGLLNSLAGLISTITNVFGVQHGEFGTTSKVTLIVTAVSTRVKKKHDQEVGAEAAGRHGEGVTEKVQKKTTK
ncbi:hypothetical protein H0H92_006731 [Tricholoma furcatifolium]|nr:hypothetical protein H0H92_006731 [Tricholoma furcatifolium]